MALSPAEVKRRRSVADGLKLRVLNFSVQEILDDEHLEPTCRDLDCVELWSGVASVHGAAVGIGAASVAFDRDRIVGVTDNKASTTTEDITCYNGFKHALGLVMRLRPGGLLWMAPVCSSFLFMNLVNTKRSRSTVPAYMGATSYQPVCDGNLMAKVACVLFIVAWARAVEAAIENPANSLMFLYGPVHQTFSQLSAHYTVCARCVFDDNPYGQRPLKRYKFAATGPWVKALGARCRCPGHRHLPLVRTAVINGKRKVTGIKGALKQSQQYPRALGRAIIKAWQQSLNCCADVQQPSPRSKALVSRGTHIQKPKHLAKRRDWMTPAADSTVKAARGSNGKQGPGLRKLQGTSSQHLVRPSLDTRSTVSSVRQWMQPACD